MWYRVSYSASTSPLSTAATGTCFLREVPCNAQQQTLKYLDEAWQRCFEKRGGPPHFKTKGIDAMGIAEPDAKRSWKLVKRSDNDFLVFPKLGNVPVVVHRPLEGKVGTATITHDGDAWLVSITCEVDVALSPSEPTEQAAKPVVSGAFVPSPDGDQPILAHRDPPRRLLRRSHRRGSVS
jgi:transposase